MIPTGEKRFFWLVVVLILSLQLVPFTVGSSRVLSGDFAWYQAYHALGGGDVNVYYSYVNQARGGQAVFENLFTSETQRPTIFQPLWLAGGWLAALTKMPTPLIFQLLRVGAGLFFLLTVYRFLLWLGLDRQPRQWAFFLITFSSGLGVFLVPWAEFSQFQSYYSTDMSVPEANTFTTLYHSPLFPLSQALIILGLMWFSEAFERSSKKYLLRAGLAVFLLSILHTYDLVTVAGVLVAYGLARLLRHGFRTSADVRRYAGYGLALIPFVIPAALYFLLVLFREPAVVGWIKQNVTISPPVWPYLLGFGLLVPLAIAGAGRIADQPSSRAFLLPVWAITASVLMYFPDLQWQRRLSSGLHVPLAILAGVALFFLWQRFRQRSRIFAVALTAVMIIGLTATPVALIARDSLYLLNQEPTSDHPYFFTSDERAVHSFLEAKAGATDIIYSHPWTGNELAGMGRRVFIGHDHQTADWEKKEGELKLFFNDWDDSQQRQYLKQHNVSWLYFGPREQTLGPWNPAGISWLEPSFSQGDIVIYRVVGL